MIEIGPPVYISWDPGGGKSKSTGMASWDAKGNLISKTKMDPEGLDMVLRIFENATTIKVFIYERYIGYSGKHHYGSRFPTAQCIGQLKAFARRWGIELVEVKAEVKRLAALHAGFRMPPRGQHLKDDDSAYLIGFHYLDKIGLIRPKVLDDDSLRIEKKR